MQPPSAPHCEILTDFDRIESIALEWQELHAQAGNGIFNGYEVFRIWWQHLGKFESPRLRVATLRDEGGKLQAIFPLVLRRRKLVRILEQAGHDVFDFCDILARSPKDAEILWDFIKSNVSFDVALIKDIQETDNLSPLLSRSAKLRKQHENFMIPLNAETGNAWLAAQSKKFRNDIRYKTQKLQARGASAFHIFRQGNVFPLPVIDALYEQKKAWVKARFGKGGFLRKEMKDFLRELALDAAKDGTLYLAWLTCDDAIIACHMGFIQNKRLYLYIPTYDAEYAPVSPGNLLMVETVKAALGWNFREVDLMRGDDAYKKRFTHSSRPLSDFAVGGSWLGKILVRMR